MATDCGDTRPLLPLFSSQYYGNEEHVHFQRPERTQNFARALVLVGVLAIGMACVFLQYNTKEWRVSSLAVARVSSLAVAKPTTSTMPPMSGVTATRPHISGVTGGRVPVARSVQRRPRSSAHASGSSRDISVFETEGQAHAQSGPSASAPLKAGTYPQIDSGLGVDSPFSDSSHFGLSLMAFALVSLATAAALLKIGSNSEQRLAMMATSGGLKGWWSPPPTLPVGKKLNVQQLGFGTWSWGNKLLWGYDEGADATLQAAFDSVVSPSGPLDQRKFFFDTGDSYGTGALEGRAESLLGQFRRESPRPDKCVIGTKLAVYPNRLTGESFENACRGSLKRMGRDQIEIVQAHWSAKNLQPWQEPALWDGLARCYESGIARSVGTSNFGPKQLAKVNRYWRDRGVPHTVNQVQLSLLSTLPIDSGLIDECRELGVTPIGYSPLALGVLTGKYDLERLPSGPRGLIFKQLLPSLQPLLGTLREIAMAKDVSMSAVAINWAMSKGCLVIVGMKTPEQVADNLQALTFTLSSDEVDELERAARKGKQATQNIFQTD